MAIPALCRLVKVRGVAGVAAVESSRLPEPGALGIPQRWRIHRQVKKRDVVGQGAVEDGGQDVRRQCGQVDHPAHVAVVEHFPGDDLLEGLGLARLQHGQPAVTPGQCQMQRRGGRAPRPSLGWFARLRVDRQRHQLAPAPPLHLDRRRQGQPSIAGLKPYTIVLLR
jgi:hypothetical protein